MSKLTHPRRLRGPVSHRHTVIRSAHLLIRSLVPSALVPAQHLNRHRADINYTRKKARTSQEEVEDLEAEVVTLRTQIANLEGRLCHCGDGSPVWSGRGTADAPLELDEEGSQGSFLSATSSAFSTEHPAVVQVSTVTETVRICQFTPLFHFNIRSSRYPLT
jgi:hypothetical protein